MPNAAKQKPKQLDVPIGNITIENIGRHNDYEDCYLGTVRMLGAYFHCDLIRVREDKDGNQFPTRDPHRRLEDLHFYYQDCRAFASVEIPGLPGRYVLIIYPHKW